MRAKEVDRSVPDVRVGPVLERLRTTIGLPQSIGLDNGPEFAGRTRWPYAHHLTVRYSTVAADALPM
jgi:putative transposase